MFDTKVKRINVKTSHPNKDKKNDKDEESRSFKVPHVSVTFSRLKANITIGFF